MKKAINKICYFVYSFRRNEDNNAPVSSGIEQEHDTKSGWLFELLQEDNPRILDNDLDIKGFHEALDDKVRPKKVQQSFLLPGMSFFQFPGNMAAAVCLFFLLTLFYYPVKDQQNYGMYHTDSLQVNQQHLDTISLDHSLKDTIYR